MSATDKKGVAMANEPGGAMRGVTRREAVTLGLAGATALALGGICGQARAAGAGGTAAKSDSAAKGSNASSKDASADSSADNTSTKSNKSRKFKEIPEEALISVNDLHELFDAGKLKEVILVALKNSNRLAETWFTLIANGYDEELVKVLDGGVKAWADAGYPTLEDQFLGC